MDFQLVFILAIIFALDNQVRGAEIKTVYTNGLYYSQYFSLEENLAPGKTLRFSVRTSRDAHIVLAPSHQTDGPVYEIVLGAQNNTMSLIRGRCPCREEPSAIIRTVSLLNEREFRNFWIRIHNDGRKTFIQVGLGGEDIPFQKWRDPRPLKPQYLSFRSGTFAEWRYGYSDAANTVALSKDRRQTLVTATGYGQYFPLSEVVSHSDNDVTLYFTVRTAKEFQILLSPTVNYLGDVYEIGISDHGAYLRRRHSGRTEAIYHRDGFVNEQERLEFCIKLTKYGEVMLGTGDSVIPVITWVDPNPLSAQFVSFTMNRPRRGKPDGNIFANLQYGLGPDYTLESQDCKPRWKDSMGQRLPPGAVRGGYNNQIELFICRGDINGLSRLPASFMPVENDKGICQLSSGWSVVETQEFQALTGCRLTWEPASFGGHPKGAIVGGHTANEDPLYVARVAQMRQVVVGKLEPKHLITYAIFSNTIVRPYTHYEVLVNAESRQ